MSKEIIKQGLTDMTAKALKTQHQGDFVFLQRQANNFLKSLVEIQALQAHFYQAQKISEKTAILANYMHLSDDNTQRILALQHNFETALHDYLGKKVFLAYVTQGGTIRFLNEESIEKVYQKASAVSYGGPSTTGYISSGSKVEDVNDLNSMFKELNNQITKRQGNIKPAFKLALDRYKKNQNENYMEYSPSFRTFYWRNFTKGHPGNKVLGHSQQTYPSRIAEAYMDTLVNEKEGVQNNHQEALLRILSSHIDHDSIPAALREDIVYKEDGSIQFAVKYKKFQTASVVQYINLATNIASIQSEAITQQDFKKALPGLIKIDQLSEKILQALEKNTLNEIQDQLKILAKTNNYSFTW